MKRLGFIHDMMDVKVLVLYVTARTNNPVTMQEIYELCYQDECLSYFDVCTAVPQLVESGHLEKLADEHYRITAKGKENGALTEDTVAFTVRQKAERAVDAFNRKQRRSSFVKTRITERENGEFAVAVMLDDELSSLMQLELTAPNERQAIHLSKRMEEKAEMLYNLAMTALLEDE